MLDQVKILSIARRSTTDDIIHLDVVLLFTEAAAVHGVRELHEDRVLLHDALDVLTADTDNTLMVLVRNMEGDGSRHLLFDKI